MSETTDTPKGRKPKDKPETTDTPKRLDPEPAKSFEAGDKTPEYVAWYKRNHSAAEFEAKYGHRKVAEVQE